MWSIRAFAVTWMLGGELPQDVIVLDPPPEGSATLRRVAFADQERWRDRRHIRRRGRGAMGDPKAHFPWIPIPEFLLDCCTVGAELYAEQRLPDDAITNPHDYLEVHHAARLDALTFRAAQVADVLRLVVEPNLQSLVQEVDVTVSRLGQLDKVSRHSWVPLDFLWRHLFLTWSLRPERVADVTRTWTQVALGPNAETIRLPLRRLGIATARPFDEDHLIDLWVALDGLFKRESDGRIGRQKVAQRVGRLLGAEREEQKRLNTALPRSHDMRNAVVHGKPDYTDTDVAEAITVADDVLRRSLIRLAATEPHVDLTAEPDRGQPGDSA